MSQRDRLAEQIRLTSTWPFRETDEEDRLRADSLLARGVRVYDRPEDMDLAYEAGVEDAFSRIRKAMEEELPPHCLRSEVLAVIDAEADR